MTIEALNRTLESYLCREMPAGTIIGDPKWWAPRIANIIKEALSPPNGEEQPDGLKLSNSTELENHVTSEMTAHRAVYFMERFKHEEKLLGPNEQAALDFVISMLEAQPAVTESHKQKPVGHFVLMDGRWMQCKEKFEYTTALYAEAPQPEQEPVAYPCIVVDVDYSMDTAAILIQDTRDYEFNNGQYWLTTTPPQRTWVG